MVAGNVYKTTWTKTRFSESENTVAESGSRRYRQTQESFKLDQELNLSSKLRLSLEIVCNYEPW